MPQMVAVIAIGGRELLELCSGMAVVRRLDARK